MKIWDDRETLAEAAANASSIAEFLRLVNMPHQGANYKAAYEALAVHRLTLRGEKKLINYVKTPDDLVFIKNSQFRNNTKIKQRLVEDHNWTYKCYDPECPNPEPLWKGKPLSLHLDHINGINNDNRFENLRFLCPNCHTQTETYGSRNIRSNFKKKERFCECGKRISKNAKNCNSCARKIGDPIGVASRFKEKIKWPTIEEVLSELETKSYKEYAKELGVSDNAIRHYLLRNNVEPPNKPRGPSRKVP